MIVTLILNKEKFRRRCRQEDRAVQEVWEGWGPTEHKCDFAQGLRVIDNQSTYSKKYELQDDGDGAVY